MYISNSPTAKITVKLLPASTKTWEVQWASGTVLLRQSCHDGLGKKEAKKETLFYNQRREKVTVSFSPPARIPLDEERLFNVGYLFLWSAIDISTLGETDPEVYNTVYYKEYPIVTGDMDETVIITYSPKYKAYQQRIRTGQIERAIKIMPSPDKARKGKNPNDPSRFIQKTAVTGDGEIAQKQIFQLDEERIREEAMYDGFYTVVTNLEGDVREVINSNRRRWECCGQAFL